jgi:hypothetical protein
MSLFAFIGGPRVLFILVLNYGMMGEYTTNIGIKNGLYERLKERKSPGQSFSGVIEEVLMKAEKYEELQDQKD